MVIVPAEMAKPDILQTGIIMGRQELCSLPIVGNYFDEKTMYQAAYAFEQATEFHKQQPAILGNYYPL